MKVWRSGEKLLVLDNNEYTEIDEHGATSRLEPREWSSEEEVARDRYFVRGRNLLRVVERYLPSELTREEVVLKNLIDVSSDPDIMRMARIAIVDASVVAAEREAKRTAETAELARLMAEPVALGEYSAGAKQLLYMLASSIDNGIGLALLRTMNSLSRRGVPVAVADAFAKACLVACGGSPDCEPAPRIALHLAPDVIAELERCVARLVAAKDPRPPRYFRAAEAMRAIVAAS